MYCVYLFVYCDFVVFWDFFGKCMFNVDYCYDLNFLLIDLICEYGSLLFVVFCL